MDHSKEAILLPQVGEHWIRKSTGEFVRVMGVVERIGTGLVIGFRREGEDNIIREASAGAFWFDHIRAPEEQQRQCAEITNTWTHLAAPCENEAQPGSEYCEDHPHDEVKEEEGMSDTMPTTGQIWQQRDQSEPKTVEIIQVFKHSDVAYVTYVNVMATTEAEPLTRRLRKFRDLYEYRERLVDGGLYWSKSEEAFYLHQGAGKPLITFLPPKTPRGVAVTASSKAPEDLQRVRHLGYLDFTLYYR